MLFIADDKSALLTLEFFLVSSLAGVPVRRRLKNHFPGHFSELLVDGSNISTTTEKPRQIAEERDEKAPNNKLYMP